nr:Rrf2 family transcriptional regulator [uncultured Sphingomonas sp.]
MQLSLQTDYALRILMALAASEEQLSVDWIARHYGISRNHLAKVAQGLQAEGFVTTYRGRGGGMRLACEATDINVGDVVRRFENLSAFVSCMPGGTGCAINGACGLKPALSGALSAFLTHLDGYRLTDIVPKPSAMMQRLAAAEATAAA